MRRAFEEAGCRRSANTAENEENVASHGVGRLCFPKRSCRAPFISAVAGGTGGRSRASAGLWWRSAEMSLTTGCLDPRRVTGEPREGEVKGQTVAH